MIKGNIHAAAIRHEDEVAEICFDYGYDGEEISIHRWGCIYRLPEAYERGFLTKTDLEKLSERYYNVGACKNNDTGIAGVFGMWNWFR